jgi:CheY-like chemotaxis protein
MDDAVPNLRSRELINAYLDRLDAMSPNECGEERAEERFKYRVRELTVDISPGGSGTWRTYTCPSRNISANGISVIMPHFVYPNTPCRVTLVSLHNHRAVHSGRAVRCRYLTGTARLHEVGIKFDSPINVGMFHRGAMTTHLLVVDDDKAIHKLIDSLLHEENVSIESLYSGSSAVEMLMNRKFDIGLIDINLPEKSGIDIAKEARASGVSTPLVAITVDEESESRAVCMQAGFDLWVGKPLSKSSLLTLVRSMRSEPIISSCIHEPSMLEVIDDFVRSVDGRIAEMQDAQSKGDWTKLAAQLKILRADSISAGFEIMSNNISEVHNLVAGGQPDPALVRTKLSFLARQLRAAMGASCKALVESR